MKNIISFGKFDKIYFYINLAFVSGIFILIVIIFITYAILVKYCDLNKEDKIKNNILIPFFDYFGQILCLIPDYIIKKCFKKQEIKNKNSNIKYIYKDQLNKFFNFLNVLKLIGISLLSLIHSILLIGIMNYSGSNDNYNINSIDLNNGAFSFLYMMYFLLCKFMFKQKYYKHQYYSIIGLTIIELIKYIYFIINNNYQITNIIFFLLFIIIYSLVNSSVYVYKKYLIEKQYFSIYKTCYVFGFINIPIIVIIILIFTFLSKDNFYILNINEFLNELISAKLIIYLLFSIFSGFNGIIINLILNHYSVFHISLPFILFLIIIEIIINIYQISIISMDMIKSIIIIILDILEVIFILVFL